MAEWVSVEHVGIERTTVMEDFLRVIGVIAHCGETRVDFASMDYIS